MIDSIEDLRESIVSLASKARQLKCEAEDQPPVIANRIEQAEDALDSAARYLASAIGHLDP